MTATITRKRKKPTACCVWCPVGRTLDLTAKSSEPRVYTVDELAHDTGRAFRLVKRTVGSDPEGDQYVVVLDGGRPDADSCECRGFLRWGTACVHITAMRSLAAQGVDFSAAPLDMPSEAELEEMGSAASNGASGAWFPEDRLPEWFGVYAGGESKDVPF